MLLKTFHAARKADPYSPTAPTLIARRFDEDREIPEARVKAMLEQVLTSPLAAQRAQTDRARLGRPLEPFDIWYNGFRADSKYTEAQLDEIVAKRYPNAEAYKKDIPNLLMKLGFAPERAQYIADNIVVDPARGVGSRDGRADALRESTLADPHRKIRHELQRLQYCRSRDGPQRRADAFPERCGSHSV